MGLFSCRENKDIIEKTGNDLDNWQKEYRKLTRSLSSYGWFTPSYLMGADFSKVAKTVAQIEANPPVTNDDRREAEKLLYYSMADVVFHPNFRTRLIWHGTKVPHFREFSHIAEMAIFAMYKRDYAGSILLMLCALEGSLRSFTGIKGKNFASLMAAIQTTPLCSISAPLTEAHAVYRDALAGFLSNWLYKNTQHPDVDFSLSVLNRHYVIHGTDPANFYRPQDAHRLMLAMDLLLDFLIHSTEIWEPCFLPEEESDPAFDMRRDYYVALHEGDLTFKQMWRREKELLKTHQNYVEPDVPEPNEELHRLMGTLDFLNMMKKAGATPS